MLGGREGARWSEQELGGQDLGGCFSPIPVGLVCRSGTQGSPGTFAFTGAVQPSTRCTVDFPPPRCTCRKLLSTDGSSFFIPPSALDWEEKGGRNMPKQGGIILLPPPCSCTPTSTLELQKKLCWPLLARLCTGGSQKGRRTSPCFHLLTPPWVCSMG